MNCAQAAEASQAIGRSALMQLLGKGFAHPEPEFHRQLLDSSYQQAVARLGEPLCGRSAILAECDVPFPDYESNYIALFQHGRRGRPAVSLQSGDYPELLDGKTRAEHLLDCLAWYAHFGLDLPHDQKPAADHLVCQLDFMAWLAFLEGSANGKAQLADGYRRAQRDFLEMQLLPHLQIMLREFGRLDGQGETMEGFGRLIRLALDIAEQTSSYLDQPRVMCSP